MTIYNFSGGPAALPKAVLNQAKEEMFDWLGSGISLLEMPFTGEAFKEILFRAEKSLRKLLSLPATHHILFMQGGAYAHYGLLAMNLMKGNPRACYFDTGHWSNRAIKEAAKYGEIDINRIHPDAAYCHLTSNETTNGKQFHTFPDVGALPLVADMTSDLLTRPVDFDKFDLIYASAQKNVAPAGLTIVIIHEKLFERALDITPTVFNYTEQAKAHSKVNTPNTFGIYMAGLMFDWLLYEGGLSIMARRCLEKSTLLYDAIDNSAHFKASVDGEMRSHVNVCFSLPDQHLNDLFIKRAEDEGLLNLKGHPKGGPIRASLYNALPLGGAQKLSSFIKAFDADIAKVA